jgi:heme/copper-type cytochrome/quinol oxidase subunit 2
MKTKIFLPVLAMLSLMLFSFTTNTDAKDFASIEIDEQGTYYINNVTFEGHDQQRLLQLEEFALNHIPQRELRVTISKVETWNEKDFTKSKFIVFEVATDDVINHPAVVEYRSNLDEIMSRYIENQ